MAERGVCHGDRNRGVDQIGGAGSTAEPSGRPSRRSVQRHLVTALERTRQSDLSIRVPPSLADGSGGSYDPVAVLKRRLKGRQQLTVAAVQRNQRPRIKNERRHRTCGLGPWRVPLR